MLLSSVASSLKASLPRILCTPHAQIPKAPAIIGLQITERASNGPTGSPQQARFLHAIVGQQLSDKRKGPVCALSSQPAGFTLTQTRTTMISQRIIKPKMIISAAGSRLSTLLPPMGTVTALQRVPAATTGTMGSSPAFSALCKLSSSERTATPNLQKRFFHAMMQKDPSGWFVRPRKGPYCPAASPSPTVSQIRNFKFKKVLQKRCKDCYQTRIKGQWMILCKTHPRHKQKKIMPKEKFLWILTHATSGTKRPW